MLVPYDMIDTESTLKGIKGYGTMNHTLRINNALQSSS